MKAFQLVKYGAPSSSVFKEVDVEKPTLSKDNELLVKVHAFGLNYADVMARKGLYKAAPPLPCVLGYEVIGEIVSVKNTKNKKWIGKRVLAMTRFGGYAEYAKTVINGIVEIPKEISNGAALALATQYCTAYFALCHEIKLYPGETVLIHAASGGVGTALTQLAKWKGCKVIGLTRSAKKVDYLTKNGVDLPIVTTETDYKSEVNNYPEYNKVSAAFNAVGGTTVKKDLSILDINGKLVFYGISDRSKKRKGMFFTLFQFFKIGKFHPVFLLMKSQGVIGLNLLSIADQKPEKLQYVLKELVKLAKQKYITPVADYKFDWKNLPEAHDGFEKGKFTGKIYIQLDGFN